MKVELKPFTGVNFMGQVIEQPQKFVYVDGQCVGYLPDEPHSRILPTVDLAYDDWVKITEECERIRGEKVSLPVRIIGPREELIEQDEDN